jgi:cation transport ATPase
MLLIVAIGMMIEEFIFGEPFQEETANAEAGNQALGAFVNWANANPGWAMMITSCFFILPTWLFFRYAPKNPRHTLPEGFFIQVFMASLLVLIAIITSIIESRWVMILMFIYYFFAYRQLFGYGWWGTLWRTGLCIYFGVFTFAIAEFMGNVVIGAPHEKFLTIAVLAVLILLMALIGYFIERRNKKKTNQ